MKRFAETTNCKLPEFRAEALQYKEMLANVQNEAGIHVIHSVKIDSTFIKADITSQCIQWQEKLMRLLNDNASNQLYSIHDFLVNTKSILKCRQVENSSDLNARWSLVKNTRMELPTIRNQITVIEDSYELLKEFDFTISEEEQSLVYGLRVEAGDQMDLLLNKTELLLSEVKVSMRRSGEASFRKFTER